MAKGRIDLQLNTESIGPTLTLHAAVEIFIVPPPLLSPTYYVVVPVEKGTVDSTEIIQDKGTPLTRTNTCKVLVEQNEADLERLTGNAVEY